MQLDPSQISSVEDAGTLDGSPVKLIRTKGGFWMGVGRRRGGSKDEVLSCGSHPAIVRFNIQKQFSQFQPAMMKSESGPEAVVECHSHFLSEDLRKSGHDIHSVQIGPEVSFQISKHNLKIAEVGGSISDKSLVLKGLPITKEFSRAVAGATTEKAISCGLDEIKIGK